jgi:hypothetical protein
MPTEKHCVLAGLLVVSCCDDRTHEPTFCVYRGTEVQDVETLTTDSCGVSSQPAAGDALIFVHDLPDDVAVEAELELTLSTPCTTVRSRHAHPKQRLLVTTLAPAGAECLLSASATILNASNTVVIGPGEGGACANLDEVCQSAPPGDAGAP